MFDVNVIELIERIDNTQQLVKESIVPRLNKYMKLLTN